MQARHGAGDTQRPSSLLRQRQSDRDTTTHFWLFHMPGNYTPLFLRYLRLELWGISAFGKKSPLTAGCYLCWHSLLTVGGWATSPSSLYLQNRLGRHRNTVRNAHEPSVRSGLASATSGSHTGHGHRGSHPCCLPKCCDTTASEKQSGCNPSLFFFF